MRVNSGTLKFSLRIAAGDTDLADSDTKVLNIFGKRFDHTEANKLIRSA
ncbi:MAG: hypothetical protein VW835_19375 [Rickettsiales bacterium]|jgi:hypothetical protein